MSRQFSVALGEQVRELLTALDGLSFDIAMVAEHARDDSQGREQPLFCARIMVRPSGKIIPRRRRWLPFLPEVETWALGNAPWISDLRKVARTRRPGSHVAIGKLPGVHTLLKHRIRSLLCLPILEGERLAAFVLVCSKQESAYDNGSCKYLKNTRAEAIARGLFVTWREKREALVREMRVRFTPKLSPEALASDLVTRLANELDWEFVGIYRVENRFVLVGSCDRTRSKVFQIEPKHRQDLDKGMMGTTLRRRVCLRADDVDVSPRPFNYMPLKGFPARSALCYPIIVGGKVEWILDCASVHASAFRGPDLDVLKLLVEALQSTLELWFEYRLSAAILNGITQCVLVVDRDGMIQRANRSACNAFGTSLEGRTPASLAYDEPSRQALCPLLSVQNARVQMRSPSGRPQAMFATARMSGEAFGRWVLQFTDADEQQILAGLSYAKATVEEVATNARGPLMLARALIGKISKAVRDEAVSEKTRYELDRVSENLGKVDLNYERLAGALRGKERVNLTILLNQIRATLSKDIPGKIEIMPSLDTASVLGNLADVSRTLLLILREASKIAKESVLQVTSTVRGDHVAIGLPARDLLNLWGATSTESIDPLGFVENVARVAAGSSEASLQGVRSAAEAEGWQIAQRDDGIEVRLPRAKAEVSSTGTVHE